MSAKKSVLNLVANAAYAVARKLAPAAYAQDGLITVHSHAFMESKSFADAYARGVATLDGGKDYAWHWRVHVGLWAASVASKIPGDFVECGVNRGFMSSAIMRYLGWNSLDRHFYLLDTFSGLDAKLITEKDVRSGVSKYNDDSLRSGFYVNTAESVRQNFAEWDRVHIVVGSVPETLTQVSADRIAYLHLDMNCAAPEVAAISQLWPKLSPGAIILLDDYAYFGFTPQRLAMDEFAATMGIQVCSLPTGQGLIIKPTLS